MYAIACAIAFYLFGSVSSSNIIIWWKLVPLRCCVKSLNAIMRIFSGQILKRYFATLLEKQCSTRIGGFWDRKGENEIDLITLNELEKSARIIEIKRQKRKIDIERLWIKGAFFIKHQLKDYQVEYLGLSMEDM